MNLAYPTIPTARQVQAFGNVNPAMYPGSGRHMGVDISAKVGTHIFAACPGVVDTANFTGAHGYGRHVIIEHGDFRTLYAHLHQVFVMSAQTVEAGALIGEMGGDPTDHDKIDGASTGPHLHFEVILDHEPKIDFVKTVLGWTVNPFKYLLDRFAPPAVQIGTVTEAEGLRIRLSPGTGTRDTIIDALGKHMRFEVAETKDVDAQTQWARIRSLRAEWVCVKYQGKVYARLERLAVSDQPAPLPPSPPAPEGASPQIEEHDLGGEKVARLGEVARMMAYLEARRKELE